MLSEILDFKNVTARVEKEILPGCAGQVWVHGTYWRAETNDGRAISPGSNVLVVKRRSSTTLLVSSP